MNIWRDRSAAATVRSLREGTETVPTVATADGRLVAADVDAMKGAMASGMDAIGDP